MLEIPLYSGPVPNALPNTGKEKNIRLNGVMWVQPVITPTLTVFRPVRPNGKSIIICPGGGYQGLAFNIEGTDAGERFRDWGYTVFVLKYRVPLDTLQQEKKWAPLQDAQKAIRTVRNLDASWGLKKDGVGIMGFSAGGHLAATASNHFDRKADTGDSDTTSARPDFTVLIYPVISMDTGITHTGSRLRLLGENPSPADERFFSADLQVSAKTPPVFLVHAADDEAVPVGNSQRYANACQAHGVPAALHLYPKGGHGFGLKNASASDEWTEKLRIWLDLL